MMYYPFQSKADCEASLESLHWAMADVAAAHGFTVVPGTHHVLSKNAATGEDNPNAVTTRWSEPVELTDGRWGIPSIRLNFPTSHPSLEKAAGLPPPVEATPLSDSTEE